MTKQYRVLIAESTRTWSNLVRSLLINDYDVVEVNELEVALNTIKISLQPFHVIVVDIEFTNNPKLNIPKGRNTFLDELGSLTPGSNVVLLISDGHSSEHIRELARHYKIPLRYRVDKSDNKRFDYRRFTGMIKEAAEHAKIEPLPSEYGDRYSDFQILISNDYKIRATSDQGEAYGDISKDIDREIGSIELIENNMTNERFLKEFGGRLYKSIFVDKIHALFEKTDIMARYTGRGVRIRLIFQNDYLARVPWEFLYREDGDYYIAQHTQYTLSRYLDLNKPRQRSAKGKSDPLEMLLIISNPQDAEAIDAYWWENLIRQSLNTQLTNNQIKLRVVKDATIENISKELLAGSPHILQFVGHGQYKVPEERGYIGLVGDDGNSNFLDESAFSSIFLGSDSRLGLVVLTACESAKSNSPRGFTGLAPRIVQMGVPSVIAMQYSVMTDTAEVFTKSLYEAVGSQRPIDWATQWARNVIAVKMGFSSRDFATPVLYMRAIDGIIFG